MNGNCKNIQMGQVSGIFDSLLGCFFLLTFLLDILLVCTMALGLASGSSVPLDGWNFRQVFDVLLGHDRDSLMVSHDLNLAAMYGDRLLLLKDGGVVCKGNASEVLTFERLENAYGCVMLVEENSLGKVPRVTPVPEKFLHAYPGS